MAVTTAKCLHCDKQYNPHQKAEIYLQLSRHTIHAITPYYNLCLDCTVANLECDATACLPKLNQAVRKLRIFERLYKKAVVAKQKLADRYSSLDQQHQYIKFFLREQRALKSTPSAGKPRAARKTITKNKQADLIASLLASMTPEQRALIAKQAAKM